MKKTIKRLSALLLIASVLLCSTSCGLMPDRERGTVMFEMMSYERPDTDGLFALVDSIIAEVESDSEYEDKLEALNSLNEQYWIFYTMLELADIRHSIDMSDEFYEAECAFFDEKQPEFYDKVDKIYTTCADSEYKVNFETDYFGEGGLDGYSTDEGGDYPEELTALYQREAALIAEYNKLMYSAEITWQGESSCYTDFLNAAEDETEYDAIYDVFYDTCTPEAGRIYCELISVRGQIAEMYGYDNYIDFCYDGYNYTCDEINAFVNERRSVLLPLYEEMKSEGGSELFGSINQSSFELLDFEKKLLSKMDRQLADIFSFMKRYRLCDIDNSENKVTGAYQTYIDWYNAPFIVMNMSYYNDDVLTFTHEFGHFADAYINYNGTYQTEAAELASQGLELLSLFYLDDAGMSDDDVETLTKYRLYDAVEGQLYMMYINQLETGLYMMPYDTVTPETISKASMVSAAEFGFNDDIDYSKAWMEISHIFAYPLYSINYAISEDAAFQLYTAEAEQSGAGVSAYMKMLENNDDMTFEDNLKNANLESPVKSGRTDKFAAAVKTMWNN